MINNSDINHIQASNNPGYGWCESKIEQGTFYFNDAEAAIINGYVGGQIEPCRKCIIEIIKCLLNRVNL